MSRALRQHECSMRRHECSMRQHPLPHHAVCMLPVLADAWTRAGFAVELPRHQSSIRYRIMPHATDACTRSACVTTVEGVAAACARCDASCNACHSCMHAGGGVGVQAMLKFENNAGTLDHKDAAFEKPVLLSVIIKVPPLSSSLSSLSSLRYLLLSVHR